VDDHIVYRWFMVELTCDDRSPTKCRVNTNLWAILPTKHFNTYRVSHIFKCPSSPPVNIHRHSAWNPVAVMLPVWSPNWVIWMKMQHRGRDRPVSLTSAVAIAKIYNLQVSDWCYWCRITEQHDCLWSSCESLTRKYINDKIIHEPTCSCQIPFVRWYA
jgi:hypothetical protein